MKYSKAGNDKSGSRFRDPPTKRQGSVSRSRFFSFLSVLRCVFSWSITDGKTVIGNKSAISWECCPRKNRIGGMRFGFSHNIPPPP